MLLSLQQRGPNILSFNQKCSMGAHRRLQGINDPETSCDRRESQTPTRLMVGHLCIARESLSDILYMRQLVSGPHLDVNVLRPSRRIRNTLSLIDSSAPFVCSTDLSRPTLFIASNQRHSLAISLPSFWYSIVHHGCNYKSCGSARAQAIPDLATGHRQRVIERLRKLI